MYCAEGTRPRRMMEATTCVIWTNEIENPLFLSNHRCYMGALLYRCCTRNIASSCAHIVSLKEVFAICQRVNSSELSVHQQ